MVSDNDSDENPSQKLEELEKTPDSSASTELPGEEKSLFRDTGSKHSGIAQKLKNNKFLGNRKLMVGAGAGVLAAIISGAFFFSFLGIFQLDQLLSNIDVRTFSRFNASFSGRSDSYLRAYIKMRMLEIEGTNKPDGDGNLFFRSNRVDTDNPTVDWYRTMRTSKFEDDLFKNDGVRFTSVVDKDGKIRPGKITIGKNTPGYDVTVAFSGGGSGIDDMMKQIDNKTVKIFENNADARRAIRKSVDNNTRFWRVLKRRHIRRDIYNMTGIKEWRFFEKTRDKLDNSKIAMQRKIVSKTFSGNNKMSLIMRCIMGVDSCSASDDPTNPDNKVDTAGGDGSSLTDEDEGEDVTDGDGDSEHIDAKGDDVADSIDNAVDQTITGEIAEKEAKQVGEEGVSKLLTKNLIKEIVGSASVVTKVWSWAKRLASIDKLFSSSRDGDSKIVKIVKMARLAQLMGVYGTYSISQDQIHSGELVGDELTNFYGTMNGYGNSEGWAKISNSSFPKESKVKTDVKNSASKDEYCKDEHDPKFGEFAWFCDSDKPDGGGNAQKLTENYDSTIGYILSPIAAAVNGVRSIPFLGDVIDWISKTIENIAAAIFEPIINGILKSLGLDQTLETLIGWVMNKIMTFLGVGPMFDGSGPGVANYLIAGSAGTAETGTRASGGMAQTEISALYSNELAESYNKERKDGLSTYDRYLSLNNQQSLLANTLFSISDTKPSSLISKLGSLLNMLPRAFASIFGHRLFAQNSSEDLTDWAGVDKYDIPRQCIELDPLDPNYLTKGVFLNGLQVNLTYDLVRDTDAFWLAVNTAAVELLGVDAEEPGEVDKIVKPIWNCHLLDARVEGGMGYLYGYEKDNGYRLGVESDDATPTAPGECAAGSENVGQEDGYDDGNKFQVTLCAIDGTNSSSEESTPGSSNYVQNAKGRALVRAEASAGWVDLFKAAKADRVNMAVSSSFRTMAHQISLCNIDPACKSGSSYASTAKPGTSNHQQGIAIDFTDPEGKGGSPTNPVEDNSSETYKWLDDNAENYEVVQYWYEAWHWQWEGRL